MRYLMFFVGVVLMSIGISLVIRANLGTSPISALPFVASLWFSPSIGFFTILMNLFFVAIQLCIMRGKFPRVQYLQIFVGIMFGLILDLCMELVPQFNISNYFYNALILVSGIFIMAVGIYIEVRANVLMLPGDAAVFAIHLATQRNFGSLKIAFDATLSVLALLLSLVLFHEVMAVREGTVACAILTGFFVKTISALVERVQRCHAK